MSITKDELVTLIKWNWEGEEFTKEELIAVLPKKEQKDHKTLKIIEDVINPFVVRSQTSSNQKETLREEKFKIPKNSSSIKGEYIHSEVKIPHVEIHSKNTDKEIIFKDKDLSLIENKSQRLDTSSLGVVGLLSVENIYNNSSNKSQLRVQDKEQLDYARPLDVYKFCPNPKLDLIVDHFYKKQFNRLTNKLYKDIDKIENQKSATGKINVREKNLKIKPLEKLISEIQKSQEDLVKVNIRLLLIELMSIRLQDTSKYLSVSRNTKSYSRNSRYNTINISSKLLLVLDVFEKLGFVEYEKGVRVRGDEELSFTRKSRYRPTEKFHKEIAKLKGVSLFEKSFIEVERTKPNLILRKRVHDEYLNLDLNIQTEFSDNKKTKQMIRDLCDYNNLLRRSLIDLPGFPTGGIFTEYPRHKTKVKFNDDGEKFVSRVFNNQSWKDGGRYEGGWWQKLPSEWKRLIRINGKPVIEFDYSTIHIVLLYALEGIDYHKEYPNKDPYDLSRYGYKNDERLRDFLKVVLIACVKNTDTKSFVEQTINSNYEQYSWVQDYLDVEEIITFFKNYHKPISKYLDSNKNSLNLDYFDSLIAEKIINGYTKLGIPVLSNHDSFIIPWDKADVSGKDKNLGWVILLSFYQVILDEFPSIKFKPTLKEQGGVDFFFDYIVGRKRSKNKTIPQKLTLLPPQDGGYWKRSDLFLKRTQNQTFITNWYTPDEKEPLEFQIPKPEKKRVSKKEKEKEKTKKARLEEQLMRDTYKRYEWKPKASWLNLQKSTTRNKKRIKAVMEQRGRIAKPLGKLSIKDLRIKFKELIEENFGVGTVKDVVEFNLAMAKNVCIVHGGFSEEQWETIYKDMLTPNSKNSICVSDSFYAFPL